jgi:hypothetical protein
MSSSARVALERCNRGLVDWSMEAKREVERPCGRVALGSVRAVRCGHRPGLFVLVAPLAAFVSAGLSWVGRVALGRRIDLGRIGRLVDRSWSRWPR